MSNEITPMTLLDGYFGNKKGDLKVVCILITRRLDESRETTVATNIQDSKWVLSVMQETVEAMQLEQRSSEGNA